MATSKEPPKPAAEDVSLDRIHPWAKNPHPPSSHFVREVVASVRRFGWGAPILARLANGEIIAGHARYLAAKRLKLTTVPVRFMDLSEPEAHVLAMADNKIPENRDRDWTDASITALLVEAEEAGIDLETGTGFSEDEIDGLLAEAAGETGSDGDDEGTTTTYDLLVTCTSEKQQTEVLGKLVSEGLSVSVRGRKAGRR